MILTFVFLIIISSVLIELNHQLTRNSPLLIKPKKFKKSISNSIQKYIAWVEISNPHKKMEVMIPSFNVTPKIIGISEDEILNIKTKVIPLHPDFEEENNDYWSAYILKSKHLTTVKIEVEFDIKDSSTDKIECLWLDIEWVNYGPFGFFTRFDGFAIPYLSEKFINNISQNNFVEPIKTHILGSLDDPIKVLKTYIPKDYLPTDILTIGESPLAIMQGKYIDYRSIKTTLLAILLCKGFHPTSSLATACGMQTLINISGPTRIIFSWLIGGIFKLLGNKGMFYRLAGKQARLIDDITGTTYPYDKNIVLGPEDTKSFCMKASKELGVNIAVVDVNDLGRVKILSTNKPQNSEIIKRALTSNPAGNANQHTPIVFIRLDKNNNQFT